MCKFTDTLRQKLEKPVAADRSAIAVARGMLASRRALQDHLPAELLHDPSVDMLLTLFVARADGRSMAASELATMTSVGPAIASRWIRAITQLGLIAEGMNGILALTVAGSAAVEAAVAAVSEAQAAQTFTPRPRLRILHSRDQRSNRGWMAAAPELAAAG